MNMIKRLLGAVDRWQRRNPLFGPGYGVVKKFGDDQANLLVVSLGWYGFVAIYPLLLVVVTILGYIGADSLGHSVVKTLHQFPVIGSQFNPGKGGSQLHGSPIGLVIGLGGLLYGAQGVTQVAQQAMAHVWNVPQTRLPGFVSRLARSLAGLSVIGAAFLVTSIVGTLAVGYGRPLYLRLVLLAALVVCNIAFYYAAFLILTPKVASAKQLLPGAILGGLGFTLLTTVGTALVQRQLRNTSATYGAFASVIGVVAYLLLLAKLSVYAAELNPVLARRLWPRALPMGQPTAADKEVPREQAHQAEVDAASVAGGTGSEESQVAEGGGNRESPRDPSAPAGTSRG